MKPEVIVFQCFISLESSFIQQIFCLVLSVQYGVSIYEIGNIQYVVYTV